MVHFTENFEAIEANFVDLGISITNPGFYDDPAFIAIEKFNTGILDNYARYVHERPRSPQYDLHARKVVPVVAREFHSQLKNNGRLGACVEISGLISRTLEREGIWNTIVKGAVAINYPLLSQLRPDYFWPIDDGEFTAAHAWVMAPPFFVIDVAIRLQQHRHSVLPYIPEFVCDESTRLSRGEVVELISPEIRRELSLQGIPRNQHLQYCRPDGNAYLNTFPARLINHKGTTLKYVFFGTSAPDKPFEDMNLMEFNGKTGYEIYQELIRPTLELTAET